MNRRASHSPSSKSLFLWLTLAAASAWGQEPEPIRIGALYPTSGSAAVFGSPALDGHLMAVEEINAAGGVLGRRLETEARDTKLKPASAVAAAKELITKEGVSIILGSLSSAVGLALAEVARREKVIFVATIAKTIQLSTTRKHDYVFRTAANTDSEGRGIARVVGLYLQRDGHRVTTVADGLAGLQTARDSRPDLIVLDIMLPRLDGMEICRALRAESDVPIIMATARVDEADRLAGLDLGADDYIVKPFSPRELAARVRAVLRRAARPPDVQHPSHVEYAGISIDLVNQAVAVGENKPSLTRTEFRLLAMLAAAPGRPFTRDQIIEGVFGYDFDGYDRTVDVHVANLRRKIEPDVRKPTYVQTVHGVGYRFGDA